MMNEVYDKHSGAILFKRDKDSLAIEELEKRVEFLEGYTKYLENQIEQLKEMMKESSK